MKFLITGCNGFIGSKLTSKLCELGHDVIGFDTREIHPSFSQVSNFNFIKLDIETDPIPDLAQLKIESVIHLAVSMNPQFNERFEHLLLGTNRLLQAMKEAKTPRLLGMSSLSVLDYEGLQAESLVDESVVRCSQYERMGRYAALKSMQESIFIEYAKNQWASALIARPGLVYEEKNLNNAYVGIVKGRKYIIVKNNGQIPLVRVDSLIDGLLAAILYPIKPESYLCVNFVEDNLPNQNDYILWLRKHKLIEQGYFSVDWKLLNFLVQCVYGLSKFLRLEKYLPSLFMPQAFCTRLKPFFYSNHLAKSLLGWKPHKFNDNE